MAGFSLYLYEDFHLEISEGLLLSLDQDKASNLAQWAIKSIANLENGEHFDTSKTSNFKVIDT
ncbi:MAG: hypothetical protein ACKOMW_02995 [Actinomycetes bacterium]